VARYTGPVDRLSRREGRNLQLKGERYYKGKDPKSKRPFPPGMHVNQRIKLTPFGIQLREKQSLRRMYGVLEKQFRNYFARADRFRGVTGSILLQLLEARLDNVVYRAGLASTRAQGRQLVTHGHVRVNGKKVDIASYSVKPGDTITLSEKARAFKPVDEALVLAEKKGRKSWIEFSDESKSARFLNLPSREDLDDIEINEQLIVEFYSR
jgi:small subunit ribosomal protein S4